MERPGDTGAFEGLRRAEFTAAGHETWHFYFGELDLESAEDGLGDIFDFVFAVCWCFGDSKRHCWEFGTWGGVECWRFCLIFEVSKMRILVYRCGMSIERRLRIFFFFDNGEKSK